MSGLYLHIPFCKQACTYCDFHFSTNVSKQDVMVDALIREMELRREESNELVETIYFGGGTPSLLTAAQIDRLLTGAFSVFEVSDAAEITLEANPDDLSSQKLREISQTRINRLSIGIQSFFDEDLRMMNRAHSASEARKSLAEARELFENITIDLIYGTPGMSQQRWLENIRTALSFNIPHISAYALTVEPRTVLKKMIAKGEIASPNDEVAESHFRVLTEELSRAGFLHYEISNFGKPGYFSRNNSAYWLGKKYLGIGPSAHSFDGVSRSWNIANNSLYLKGIESGNLNSETEKLSAKDRFNEYVMTGLRTIWGISLERIREEFGTDFYEHLISEASRFLDNDLLEIDLDILRTTPKGKFLADGLASELFITD